jgi:hypothetical protein
VDGVIPIWNNILSTFLTVKACGLSLLLTTPPISAGAASHQVFGFMGASAGALMIRLCLSTGVEGTAPAKHLRSLKPVSVYGGGGVLAVTGCHT